MLNGTHSPPDRKEGVFNPRDTLVAIAIIVAAASVGVLVWHNPQIGIPTGVAVAVAGLLHTLFTSIRRH